MNLKNSKNKPSKAAREVFFVPYFFILILCSSMGSKGNNTYFFEKYQYRTISLWNIVMFPLAKCDIPQAYPKVHDIN